MAHELEMINGMFEMAYLLSDGVPWHGHGQPVSDEDADDLRVWGTASNMGNFRFETEPVLWYDETTDDVNAFDKYRVAFRSDTRQAVEIVGANYKILQPEEVLHFFDDIIRGMGYTMTSAGVLFGGKKFWAQARTGEFRNIGGVDRVNASILLATGFDGSTIAQETTTRVVCNNTLRQATGDKTGQIRVPHSTVFDAAAVKDRLGLNPAAFREWCDVADAMAQKPMENEEALEYFGDVFEIYTQEEADIKTSQKAAIAIENKTVAQVFDLFRGDALGSDLTTADGTLWGALNSVTEFIDHHRRTNTVSARMNGAWFGTQANIKQRAWDTAMLKAA